jgi:hypothetical protein
MQLITHQDVEELYRKTLDEILNQVKYHGTEVYSTSTPSILPPSFVLIETTGGEGIANKVFDHVQLTFDVRSRVSEQMALELAYFVCALVADSENTLSNLGIYKVDQLNRPYLAPDIEDDRYFRYITSFTITLRTTTIKLDKEIKA